MSEKTLNELIEQRSTIEQKIQEPGATEAARNALQEQLNALNADIESRKRNEIEQKKAEHDGGLKELVYQIFETVIPEDVGIKAFGPSDFADIGQSFRQLIDQAVDETNANLYAFVAQQLEEKDAKIAELTTATINLDAELQEANRKEEFAVSNYERAMHENERLEAEVLRLSNVAADKDVQLAEQDAVIQAKEDQIAKLTEQLNQAPKPQIILPGQSKPSQSLAERMQEVKDKRIKSQMELVMERFGIAPPMVDEGGSNDSDTFLEPDQAPPNLGDTQALEAISPPVGDSFQDEDTEDRSGNVVAHAAIHEDHEQTVEERLFHLECETTQLHDWLKALSDHAGFDTKKIYDEGEAVA